MIKIAIVCLTITLIIICAISMAGCSIFSNLFEPSDNDDMEKKINTFLECLQNKDKEGIKNLFAQNKVSQMSNFDKSIEELFEYYDGEYTSISRNSPGVENDKDAGIERKWYNMSYDVTVGDEIYRMAFMWCAKDTSDKGNVGIESFYIIKASEDPHYPPPICLWGRRTMDAWHKHRQSFCQNINI